jgi:hypothetical protein
MATSFKVTDDLFLVQQQVAGKPSAAKPAKPPPVNHIVVIDCSYSMSWDLPKIREQLKKKVPKLLGVEDTLSVIWFASRGQFGTLLEAEPVATLTDLQAVNTAIDRWLRPVGLTGFKEPMQEAKKLVERVGKNNKGAFSLFFMSDGCDNQWNRNEILKAVEETAGGLSSATFVEYGYYADRPLLSKMAEKAGGTLIFSEDFDKYAPLFEGSLGKTVSGAPRKEISVKGDPVEGFAFALVDGDLLAFSVEGDKVTVPSDLNELWYLNPTSVGGSLGFNAKAAADPNMVIATEEHAGLSAAYAAVSLYAQRMKPNVVYPLLKAVGDGAFIERFAGCFGKQKYTEFTDQSKAAAFDIKTRFEQGWDPTKIPADDAFTVLDFLRILASDDENKVLLDSSDFKYSKIGRGQTDASVKAIEDLQERIAGESDAAKKAELEKELKAAKKVKPLKFVADEVPDGYSVKTLTLNENRPNISILIRKEGSVDLSKRLKKAEHKKIPRTFPTYIHRNYAIVKDGLVNVEHLPVRMTAGTVRAMVEAGLPMSAICSPKGETAKQTEARIKKASKGRPVPFVVNLRELPIINRKMVKEVAAEDLFRKTYATTQAKAAQKVYNSIKKAEFPRESKGFKLIFGEDAAAWLKDVGVTDYNGFNPQSFQSEAKDFYMGKELVVKLAKLSSLPTLVKAKDALAKDKTAKAKDPDAKSKMTPSAALMVPAIEEVEKFLRSDAYKKAADSGQVFEAWLDGQLKASRKDVRKLQFEIAQIKFGVIVGQTWFTEFASLDETQLTISIPGGKPLECSVGMREIEVKI